MFRKTVLLSLMCLMFSTVSFAQGSGPMADGSSGAGEEVGLVSLEFNEADIKNVLRTLSYKSGVNIVAGPEVSGLVSIQLKDVPWENALKVILETYGYGYERKGNIITVTTVENLKKRREDAMILADQQPLETKTFVLNYAKAVDVIVSIEKMKSDRGSINFDERTNAIIVQDIPEKIELIATVIDRLDQTTPQVLIEAKIVETTLNNAEKLGIDWVTQASFSGAERPILFPFTTASENKYVKDDDFPGAESSAFNYGTLSFQQFQAVVELLKSRTDTNILSNPRIVTLDNKQATIQVGVDHPLPQYDYNSEQGVFQVSGFTWRTIGIIFEVTPHVNNAGYITLDLRPEVSEQVGEEAFDNINLPLISKEVATTTVMIKDGETLVIAGLIKDTTLETKKKVPILGDIPILGLAFQKTETSIQKQDLLIFLTPHIVTSDKEK